MVQDTKHFDIDLAQQLPRWVEVPPGAGAVAVLWLHGRPLGRVTLPHRGNAVYRRGLARAIVHQFSEQILRQLVRNGLATAGNTSLELDRLLALPPVAAGINANVLAVVVCTRGERPDLLERCLAGLVESDVSPAEVIVVGFGGGEFGRAREVFDAAAGRGVPMRWIDAGDGDLARARRAGVGAVAKPLVAFVDESIRVDRHWVAAMLSAFRDHPQAAAVVGSVLPGELENGPSRLLAEAEDRMAWGERFEFHWWQPEPDRLLPREWLNALRLGSGANMTFRTAAIRDAQRVGPMARGDAADPAEHLDVWLRLLESGSAVIREPAASGRDAGVGSIAEAEARVRATAAGISAALVAAAGRRPSRLWGILLLAQWFVRTSLGDSIRQRGDARTLSRVRLRGHLAGTWQGIVSVFGRRRGREVEAASETDGEPDSESGWNRSRGSGADIAGHSPFAGGRVLPVELAPEPAQPQEGSPREIRQRRGIERGRPDSMRTLKWAQLEPAVDLLACWNGMVLGAVRAITGGHRLTLAQVRRLVVDRHFPTFLLRHLGVELHPYEFDGTERKDRVGKAMDRARRELLLHFFPPAPMAGRHGPGRPAADATASIVVPTCDRPDDLRTCLTALLAQRSDRPVEIIVVDNRPASGRTPPIVAEFPGVRLVNEPRQGSAYTRNRGLLACRGSIVVFCDDDVVVPDGWLAAMLAPFDEPNVGVVTGNIVPYSLETASQRLNEATCGLGRGSEPFAVDGNWFYGSPGPVQGWEFGTTANAAVRVEVFRDPAVGLFAESLGPGTPVGAGEDPYFFYRVLKSGYRIEYLPDAWVWHKHRTSAKALRRQVYNYAKSAVGYHLMTLFADGDRRARAALLGGLQRYYLRRLVQASLGRADVPPRIVMVEIAGNLAGGFSFLASEGRRRSLASDPAHPPTPRALPATVAAAAGDEPWALRPSSTRPPAEPPPATIARTPRRRMHGPGRLPHFLVIGAQKSGTTALHHNLQKHPSIELVPNFRVRVHDWDNRKETGFFDGRGSSYGIRTLDDYRRLFNDNGLVQGESCPAYESGEALDRIRRVIPDVRLVLICREPVSRLESAFNHLRQWHSQVAAATRWATWDPTLSFEANVQAELDHPSTFGLVRMGMYAESITRVLGRFRPEQLLVLVAEEYRADPQATYDRIFDFLGVQPAIIEHLDVHIREHTTRLTDEQRQRMAEFYRPHNERFFQMIGREVPAWEGRSSPSSRVDPDAA